MPTLPDSEKKTEIETPPANGVVMATLRTMRQFFILVVGLTVALVGVALIVLPGPGALTILLGLAILGLEFEWARRWMAKIKTYLPKRKTNTLRQNTEKVPNREKPLH